MHRLNKAMIYASLLCGSGFLVAAAVNRQAIALLIGNGLLLLPTLVRFSMNIDQIENSSSRLFYKSLHLLNPRVAELESDDAKGPRSSINALRTLGILYWIDCAAIVLLLGSLFWLGVVSIQGTQQVSASVLILVGSLWVTRIALRLVWLVQLLQQAGNGSALAGISRIDEQLQSDQRDAETQDEFQSCLNRIVEFQNEGETEKAIAEATRLIEIRGHLPSAHCMRAGLLITAGRYSEAIQDLDCAVKIDDR